MLLQENISDYDMSRPLFDLAALHSIETEKSISVELVQVCCLFDVLFHKARAIFLPLGVILNYLCISLHFFG